MNYVNNLMLINKLCVGHFEKMKLLASGKDRAVKRGEGTENRKQKLSRRDSGRSMTGHFLSLHRYAWSHEELLLRKLAFLIVFCSPT